MKKITFLAILTALSFTACKNFEKNNTAEDINSSDVTREELAAAVADRDQLLSLVNEINSGVEQIKNLEQILTVTNSTPEAQTSSAEQIQADINAIQRALQERREKLAELEKKLSKSALANENLRRTIASLRSQIDDQSKEIALLKNNLAEARERIGQLDAAVDSLSNTVNQVSDERDLAQEENVNLANELNVCYYAIGSKNELKERKIIETGFLRKTKLLKGDFDQDFFTTADKRTLSRLPLHSSKAQILTNQPEGSYILDTVDGQKVLVITNPDAFWSLSNYLVVKID